MFRKPISLPKLFTILQATEGCCGYCGTTFHEGDQPTVDHIAPVSLGGSDDTTNLMACCRRCNTLKGNRSLAWFRPALQHRLIQPLQDRPLARFVFWYEAKRDGMRWEQWLQTYALPANPFTHDPRGERYESEVV